MEQELHGAGADPIDLTDESDNQVWNTIFFYDCNLFFIYIIVQTEEPKTHPTEEANMNEDKNNAIIPLGMGISSYLNFRL